MRANKLIVAVIIIVFVLAIFKTYDYCDKKAEYEFYEKAAKQLSTGIEWKYLTDEDKAEVDLYRQKLIEQNSTKKGLGARWLDNTNIERLNNLVRHKESELYSKRLEISIANKEN